MTAQGAPRYMPACRAKDGASYFGALTTASALAPSQATR